MYRRITIILLMNISILSAWGEGEPYWGSPEKLKNAILESLCFVQSIECEYTYYTANIGGMRLPQKNELRWNGTSFWNHRVYLPVEGVREEELPGQNFENYVDGSINLLSLSKRGIWFLRKNRDAFLPATCNQLSPLSVIGCSSSLSFFDFERDTLRQILSKQGLCFVETIGEETLLFAYPESVDGNYEENSYGAIIHLDAEQRIVQVDYVQRPECSLEEISVFAAEKDPKRIFKLRSTDSFKNFVQVDGTFFPTKVTRLIWSREENIDNDNFRHGLYQQFEQEESITFCELLVRLYIGEKRFAKPALHIDIVPESIRINNPNLSKESFELKPPPTLDNIVDHKTGMAWEKEEGWYSLEEKNAEYEKQRRMRQRAEARQRFWQRWWRNNPNRVFLISLVLLLASVSLLIAVLARKRTAGKGDKKAS